MSSEQPKLHLSITPEELLIVEHGCIYPDKDECIGKLCKYHDPNPSFRDNVVCLLNEHDVADQVRSRPHTSTEEEICKRCLCTSPCQPWFDEHDATIRNATLDEIHARYVDAYLNPDNYNEINAKEVYQFIESLQSKGGER